MAAMSSDVVDHNETVLTSLEEGDLVEFPRNKSLFSHWAVYVGNEEVVHLAPIEDGSKHNSDSTHISSVCGKRFPKAQIKQENFRKVAKDSKAKKNNEKDSKYSPRPKRQIVEEALKAKESLTEGYNLLVNNCEHFASWCRYDVKKSDQAESLIAGAIVVTAIIGIGFYLYKKLVRQRERVNEDDA